VNANGPGIFPARLLLGWLVAAVSFLGLSDYVLCLSSFSFAFFCRFTVRSSKRFSASFQSSSS
jgi:hypothetical protein